MLITVDNHKSIKQSKDITRICSPLFNETEITNFNYVKEFFDGRRLSLSNHADWLMYHFEKKYYQNNIEKYRYVYLYDYILVDNIPADEMIRDAKKLFNMPHGFSLHKTADDHFEFYHFSTNTENPNTNNWYLNNITLIKKFILYFLHDAKKIINSTKPYVPDSPIITLQDSYKKVIESSKNTHSSLNDITINSWTCAHNKSPTLNRREIEVMLRLIMGKTTKLTAKELFLSPRTVEYYINNIKNKFSCNNKTDLLRKIYKTSFVEDFFG